VSCRHVSSVSSYPLLCGLKCFEKAESIWKHQKKVVWTDLTHLTHLTRFLERMLWESTRISRLEIDKIQEWLTMTVVLRSPVSGMSAVAFISKPKSLRMWLARFGPRRRGLLAPVSPHDAKRSTQGPRWSKMVQEMQTKSITKSIKIQSKSNNEFLRSKTSCAKASETPFNVRTTTSNMFQSPGPKPGISSAPSSSPRPNSSQPGQVRQCILGTRHDSARLGTAKCILKYSMYITYIMYYDTQRNIIHEFNE
jgi:hypothetical protein